MEYAKGYNIEKNMMEQRLKELADSYRKEYGEEALEELLKQIKKGS